MKEIWNIFCDVMFVHVARSDDLVKKLESASTTVKAVPDCQTVTDAANSAANLISEYLLQVCCYCFLFYTLMEFSHCVCYRQ